MLAVSDKDLPIWQSSECDLGDTYSYVYTIPKNNPFHVYGQIDDFYIVTYVNKKIIYCGLVRFADDINLISNEQKQS